MRLYHKANKSVSISYYDTTDIVLALLMHKKYLVCLCLLAISIISVTTLPLVELSSKSLFNAYLLSMLQLFELHTCVIIEHLSVDYFGLIIEEDALHVASHGE